MFSYTACFLGGLLLKRPGRVGQAALYASGVWADSFSPKTESSVAVCTTGCGEHIVQTQLAKEIGCDLKDDNSFPTTALHKSMTEKFVSKWFFTFHIKIKMNSMGIPWTVEINKMVKWQKRNAFEG